MWKKGFLATTKNKESSTQSTRLGKIVEKPKKRKREMDGDNLPSVQCRRIDKIYNTDRDRNTSNNQRNTENAAPIDESSGCFDNAMSRKKRDNDGCSSNREQELSAEIVALQLEVDTRNEKILYLQKRIDSAGAIMADSLRLLKEKHDEVDTLQNDNDKMHHQLQRAQETIEKRNEMLPLTKASMEAKFKAIHNKTEQVTYHGKKASDLQKHLDETRLDFPNSCLTTIDVRQIVSTVQRILEDSCSKMQSDISSSK
ncbi:hypothetical protein ACA910_005481 [Epithemia clementina (nom. ined.)]